MSFAASALTSTAFFAAIISTFTTAHATSPLATASVTSAVTSPTLSPALAIAATTNRAAVALVAALPAAAVVRAAAEPSAAKRSTTEFRVHTSQTLSAAVSDLVTVVPISHATNSRGAAGQNSPRTRHPHPHLRWLGVPVLVLRPAANVRSDSEQKCHHDEKVQTRTRETKSRASVSCQ